MNIAIILASGNGSRVIGSLIPKQFIEFNKKPIVIHTIDKFVFNKNIDAIIVSCHEEWINYLSEFIKNQYNTKKTIHIVKGGNSRNESVLNAFNFIKSNFNNDDEHIILTHDAVRMFVSDKIINENIELCKNYSVVDTAIPSTDTIFSSKDHSIIFEIPDRKYLYNGQTPQTLRFSVLKNIEKDLRVHDTSDVCSLALAKGYEIKIANGDSNNFKITTDFDLLFAKKMVETND